MTYTENPFEKRPLFKEVLPNSQAVFVLGIISIVMIVLCCSMVGLILAIIALVLGLQGKNVYTLSPDRYTQDSYNQLKAGLIMACVSIGLNILGIIAFIILIMADALK